MILPTARFGRRRRGVASVAVLAIRAAAATCAIAHLARASRAAPPVTDGAPRTPPATPTPPGRSGAERRGGSARIDVVIPARDEAERIGPALDALARTGDHIGVIVVDDESSDDTAEIAERAGAIVVPGRPLPDGWAGKAWALQQGIEASEADWIVTLDADTRPDPRLPDALVGRALHDGIDFLTVGGRFECPTPASRWLHASMLTTLVYRFGPPGVTVRADRTMANGQCMCVRRVPFVECGAMSTVRGEVVEDIALARHLARLGWAVSFLDAADLLRVRMFESIGGVWHGWGRSIALPGVEPLPRQLADLTVVVCAQALPLVRALLRRADVLDAVLIATRVGTLVGTRSAYDRNDAAYWASPLADTASTLAIGRGIARRGRQSWRGRTYA